MVDMGEDNPFRLPPDDQIFLIREQERQKRVEDRERVKQLRVWEKTTASSRVHRNRRVDDDDVVMTVQSARTARSARTENIVRDARREKENVAEFVEKKRDMFLIQMSLDVKKAEILKLDEKAKQKDEALKKSQAMLDEDLARFDDFLQNNDRKAHDAMKNAEEQTKKKQERLQSIKTLKSKLSAVQSEIAKHREAKEECFKYKVFLEKLTPQEWRDEQTQRKAQRKMKRKSDFVSRRMTEIGIQMQSEIEAEERALEERVAEASKGRRRPRRQEEEEAREREKELDRKKRAIRRKYPTQDAVEVEYNGHPESVSSGEEMPLCFEEPKQLLDIFTSLEEQNLFLIQTSQDTEQMLEEIQQKLKAKRRTMGAAHAKLKDNIDELERSIAIEKEQSDQIRFNLSQKRRGSEQDQLLHELAQKVMEVHAACGHDTDHDPDALQMIGAIEAKLEENLAVLDEAEAGDQAALLKDLEFKKERARRDFVKHMKRDALDRKIEDRLKTSLKRSQQPIHRKVGKQIMYRSPPNQQARKVVEEDDGYEDACIEHELFGLYVDKKDGKPYSNIPKRET